MSEQSKFPRRPSTIFNDFKYPMPRSTKPVEGAKFPAIWMWEIGLNGKIFFKVRDGLEGSDDRNAKNKEVELTFSQRNSLLFTLQEAVSNPEFQSAQVQVKKRLYNPQTKRFNDDPSILATFTVIRTKSGEIKVHFARGSYELVFNMNDELLSMRTKNMEGSMEDNVGLASRAYTSSFIKFSEKFLDIEEWNRYSRETKNDTKSNSNNNTQNNSQSSTDFDDEDFDF